MSAPVLQCPKCRGPISDLGDEQADRTSPVRALGCRPCARTFLEVAEVRRRLDRPGLRLSGSSADRGHEPARSMCPVCLAGMVKVTLSWDGFWVVLEECPHCGMVALDEGELQVAGTLANAIAGEADESRAARGLQALLQEIAGRKQ